MRGPDARGQLNVKSLIRGRVPPSGSTTLAGFGFLPACRPAADRSF